jgi:hypothetical protein
MSDPTLAIIFRNPRPKRSPIDNELYITRRDGSSSQIHYSDQGGLDRSQAAAVLKQFSRVDGSLK